MSFFNDLKQEKIIRTLKQVFINDVDLYSSKCISKFLSERLIGGNSETIEDDVENETEEKKEEERGSSGLNSSPAFHVVGTVHAETVETTWVKEQYFQLNREQLLLKLMKCDVIIYNITQHPKQLEEASWALAALHHNMDDFTKTKTYILISTVMTWADSKPDRHDDEDLPFTDVNFRTRRAHPNFRKHIDLEKKVVKLGKTNKIMFPTYVVVSGLQYGMGEQIFHIFFKMSWLGLEKEIPVYGNGSNFVPTIHVNALASVIHNLIDYPPQPYYLIAVDTANNSMEEIVKAVASVLGPGKITQKPFEDVYLDQDLSMMEIDSLHVNLHMEAVCLREWFPSIQWVCESGLVENMEFVVEEYRQTRGLLPIRLCVIGPPAVGKTTMSKKICEHYRLHHITVKETISEALAQLEDATQNDDSDEDSEDVAMVERKLLREDMAQNGGYLSEHLLIKLMKNKLLSNPCKNQGFVLDGFPMTFQQARETFFAEDHESEDEATHIFSPSKNIMPEFVLYLEASDTFLRDRVINLSEKVAQEHNYQEECFLQSLAKYRQRNLEDETVVNYFDELEIPTQYLTISCETDQHFLIQKILDTVGVPRNYGLDTQEVQVQERRRIAERMRREHQQREDEEIKENEEARQRTARWEKWTEALREVKDQEEELLDAHSVPLRNYLMKHVMPPLTLGLIECCSNQPQDPVDFLAEYLIKNNPVTY
ncbi:adenylate kinase 7 [Neosynchiropus ocellatus]